MAIPVESQDLSLLKYFQDMVPLRMLTAVATASPTQGTENPRFDKYWPFGAEFQISARRAIPGGKCLGAGRQMVLRVCRTFKFFEIQDACGWEHRDQNDVVICQKCLRLLCECNMWTRVSGLFSHGSERSVNSPCQLLNDKQAPGDRRTPCPLSTTLRS